MEEKSIKQQIAEAENELEGLLKQKIRKLKIKHGVTIRTKYGLCPANTIDKDTGKHVKELEDD